MPSGSVLLLAQPISGGVARHVIDLSDGLVRRGWSVCVGCPSEGPLPNRLRELGISVEPVEYVRSVSPGGDLGGLVATRRLIRRLAPDIVHGHSSKAGFLGRLAARSLGVRATVYTPHCLAFHEGASRSSAAVYRTIERLAGPWTGRFIAVCDAEAAEIVGGGLSGPERVRRVYNGMVVPEPPDPSQVATRRAELVGPVPDGGQGAAVVFTIVGRADRQKAFDVFAEAALAALAEAPAARFALVGGDYTTTGALADIEKRVAAAGASARVRILGERDDVSMILAASDVLVMPSRWEAFPYAVLEAGAFGLPEIATPVGGVPEIVVDGRTGLLVPVDDSAAVAAAMCRLAGDGDLRRSLGRALSHAVRPLTVDRMVDETIAVYEELLAETRGRTPTRTAP